MDKQLFDELVESIQQAGAHVRGERDLPAGNVHFVGEPDPRAIRAKMQLSQSEFAALLGISVKTLQNWEQGRRSPDGPAMQLLRVAERHPEVLMELT